MISLVLSSNVTTIILAIGATATAVVLIGKAIGLIPDRTSAQEVRAEEMWKSEALAQKARADRLEKEMERLSEELVFMRKEIDILKNKPDLTEVVVKLDKIITAVVPPEFIHD